MRFHLFLLVTSLGVQAATVQAAAPQVDYLRDIKPVLKSRCYACHGALKQEANLRLDTAAAMRTGGDSGPVVVAGDAGTSLLLDRVSSTDEFTRMPPEGAPLTDTEIASLRAWIEGGLKAPQDERPERDPNAHWAFSPPRRPPVPKATDSPGKPPGNGSVNPIDAFLAAKRQARQLVPVEPVADGILLRRVYLDLIGLPPTLEQLDEFARDERPDAYERVVDRLLDSPHYGERWGRHWMDVWRYTDWYGLGKQLRYSQKHIWHWRDWIVESLNEDLGYDRMVVDMLAADEIAPTDHDRLRATGFLARNYFLFNRTTWLDNTIEHTSKALLGLTVNCAKCHDHKYDPISHDNYYQFRAFFEPHQVRLDPRPGETDLEKDGLPRVFDAHPDIPTWLHVRGDEKQPDTSREIEPGLPAALIDQPLTIERVELPATAHFPGLQDFVLADHLELAEAKIATAKAAVAQADERLEGLVSTAETESGTESDATSAVPFLQDDFAKPRPDLWEVGPGSWKHENGYLVQSQLGANRAYLRSRETHPTDFVAVLRFRTTGGEKWKSVGLCFDVVDQREKLVYLSAVSPGSKLQISYKQGQNHVYPPGAKQDRPVPLGEMFEMTVSVRGRLVNVAMDGKLALAYELPVEREVGRLDVIAFDAAVEFHDLTVRKLSPQTPLVAAGKAAETPLTVDAAHLAVEVARARLTAAREYPDVLRTAHAADVAKHRGSAPEVIEKRVAAAAAAARRHELKEAELALAELRQKLASADDKTRPKLQQDLDAAEKKAAAARGAVESPGTAYPSLRVSSKAAEGPAETEDSRRRPYPAVSTGRRTALARWITRPDNPLAARVAINHIWLRHFGQPLVEPVTDFGLCAPEPPQQDLLDWLAVEFIESGWSMKHMHRLMVTSDGYRLSTSTATENASRNRAVDPANQFYWRRRAVRMDAQTLRDSLLRLAGVLDPQLGGPTIDPVKEDSVFRRSLYFTHSRDDQHPFLAMFDNADILACYRRAESIVPQQALTMANSKLALSMARRIAPRIVADSDGQFVERAFRMMLCRAPVAEERQACLEALAELTAAAAVEDRDAARRRARAEVVHALLNHNDFVTVR